MGDKLGTKITVKLENPERMLDVTSVHAISGGPHKGFCPTEEPIVIESHQQFGFSKTPLILVGILSGSALLVADQWLFLLMHYSVQKAF